MNLQVLVPDPTDRLPMAVAVEVWEGHLLRSNSPVAKTLCTYSLDNGPLVESADGLLTFRFTAFDWENHILSLLTARSIHFTVLKREPIPDYRQLLGKKIFLAEDDEDMRFVTRTVLEAAGYQVKTAACGQPVVSGNYCRVDLFILDRRMPDIDGLGVCRYLRAQKNTRETPVLMVSALPNFRNEALGAGANDYIQKPFHMHFVNRGSRWAHRQGSGREN